MSIESAKAYLDRFLADEDFAKCIIAAENASARKAIAESEGFTFTKSEIDSVASSLSDEELSDIERGPWTGSMCECSREGELGCR